MYKAPSFVKLTRDKSKQCSQYPQFLQLLFCTISKGKFVESGDDADFVIEADDDQHIYTKAKKLTWTDLVAMIPLK